jgi:hypothetical protein
MQYPSMGIGSTASWEERADVRSDFGSVAGRAAQSCEIGAELHNLASERVICMMPLEGLR